MSTVWNPVRMKFTKYIYQRSKHLMVKSVITIHYSRAQHWHESFVLWAFNCINNCCIVLFIYFLHCFTEMVCGALTSVKMLTVHLKQLNMICIKFATWSSFNDYWRWICLARANSISLEIIQILHDCPFLWANIHSVCQYSLLYIDRKQWLTFADHN